MNNIRISASISERVNRMIKECTSLQKWAKDAGFWSYVLTKEKKTSLSVENFHRKRNKLGNNENVRAVCSDSRAIFTIHEIFFFFYFRLLLRISTSDALTIDYIRIGIMRTKLSTLADCKWTYINYLINSK